jgi:hypothetical protein
VAGMEGGGAEGESRGKKRRGSRRAGGKEPASDLSTLSRSAWFALRACLAGLLERWLACQVASLCR